MLVLLLCRADDPISNQVKCEDIIYCYIYLGGGEKKSINIDTIELSSVTQLA